MTSTQVLPEDELLVLKLEPIISLTDEQFFELCQLNRDLRIERTTDGELLIMPPTGGNTGNRNLEIEGQLWLWNRQTKLGKAFNSSTGFKLPNGAERSPDAAWIRLERWETVPQDQQEKFVPLYPDFVVELKSPTDSLTVLQNKMEGYIQNGAQLGWLIDRKQRRVYIYRAQTAVQCLENPSTLDGEPVLSGFILDLSEVW
ncbi:MAG: Uma2 family endonuclease [Leptolyngbyaceae cyanobacterium SM1_4_3]|nr:Uma2 family endonuclease [Leptolyngbyaceae cyanobacterium SM1_4_3]